MINEQLLNYVKKQIATGIDKDTVTTNLKGAGWNEGDINEVFAAINPQQAPVPIPVPQASFVSNATAPAIQEDFSDKHKSKKMIPAIVLIVLLLVAGGVALYAYYSGAFVSLSGILPQAIDADREVKSESFDFRATADFSEMVSVSDGLNSFLALGGNSPRFNLNIKGVADETDPKNIKALFDTSVDMGPISIALEIRMADEVVYFMVKKLPSLGLMFMDASEYENKWFSISTNPEELDKLKALGVSTDIGAQELTPEQTDKIYKIFREASIIKQTSKLPSETIDGELSYHFAFDLDHDGIIALIKSLKEFASSIDPNSSELENFDPASISEVLDKLWDFKGEIWIGKSDKLLRKFKINFAVQPDSGKDEKVKVDMSMLLTDYNKPVSVTAPEGAIDLESLILGSLTEARQKGKEASIKANMSSIRPYAEIFYDNNHYSYSGFCLSQELKDLRKAVEDSGGTGFVCKDSSSKYAAGVKLFESGDNWCTDFTGFNGMITTLPTGTSCPK